MHITIEAITLTVARDRAEAAAEAAALAGRDAWAAWSDGPSSIPSQSLDRKAFKMDGQYILGLVIAVVMIAIIGAGLFGMGMSYQERNYGTARDGIYIACKHIHPEYGLGQIDQCVREIEAQRNDL